MNLDVRLPDELRDELNLLVLDRVRRAVEENAERDRRIMALDDQLEGRGNQAAPNARWKNACDLEDPMTREHHLQALASMSGVWRRTQFWLCEAIDPAERVQVRQVEHYMNVRARQYGLADALYDVAYTALAAPFAPMYVGWRTYMGMVIEDQPAEAFGGEPGETLTVRREVPVYNGLHFRSIEPGDFYLWPTEVQSVEAAEAVIERRRYTADELLLEFDREDVLRILRYPDEDTNELMDERNLVDGIEPEQSQCHTLYVVTGRAPLVVHDDLKNPEWMIGEDYVWVVHPPSNTVLSMQRTTTPFRPYVVFNSLRAPRRMNGPSLASLIRPIQTEATANLRFTIDCMNLASAPAMKVPEQWLHKYGKWAMFPGALVPYMRTPDEITPLTWDMRGPAAGMQLATYLDSRASRIVSAQGISSLLGGKVRKEAEVEATADLVGQKQDLFFQCMQEGLEQVGQLVLSLFVQHMGPDGDIAAVPGGETVQVTPEDIRRRMRISAFAASEDSNAGERAKRTFAARKVQSEYFAVLGQLPPYAWYLAWNSARQSLMDLGEREPLEWIGPKPPQMPPPWMAPQTSTQQTAPALGGFAPGPVQPEQPVETGVPIGNQ